MRHFPSTHLFYGKIKIIVKCFFLAVLVLMMQTKVNAQTTINETHLIKNANFETGTMDGWKHWRTRYSSIVKEAYSGTYAVKIGPERAFCNQEAKVRSNTLYRISAYVKTESGAEEVQLIISNYGGAPKSVSSSLTSYSKISIDFQTAFSIDTMLISFVHPAGAGSAYVDEVELIYLGEAPKPVLQEFVPLQKRVIQEDLGVSQLPDEKIDWFLNDKFGMFIHWGVYAAMPEGNEWVRHQEVWGQDYYQRRARDTTKGFTASKFQPAKWADLAKKAGMKYTVLTARHHDGFALFDSKHPASWTSKKDLGRDLIKEYTDAVSTSGLRVGLYYSPMSWRYPGYYDVFGNDCKPNVWGYKTAKWHKEDANVMKEEVYEQVTKLLKDYGKISYMFWDGAWLAQTVNRNLDRSFWNPGKYQDSTNEWPINEKYITKEAETGKPLGIMGLVRKYQPEMIVNKRFSWIGDVYSDEGGGYTSGNIRNELITEKCISLQKGGWGYRFNSKVYSFEDIVMYLSNCVVRNVNLLLNVAPDREGVIPQNQQEVLVKMGNWLNKVGPGIYNTRGGPWQPLYGEYGFTYNANKIYCHIYKSYRELTSNQFTTQSIGKKKVSKVINLFDGKELKWVKNKDNTITISGVDYTQNPAATLLEITLTEIIYE
jgi:alpha-L-fucosidase